MTPDVFAANRGKRLSEVDAELLPVVEKALKHWSARGDWYESIVDGASVLWLEMFEESVPDAKPKERDDLLVAFQKDLRTTLAKTSDPSTASASQAQTITEWVSTSTANHAELRAARVNQHPALRWVTRKDNRVRSSHRAIDGTTVPAGQTFKVGDVHLAYPGEPVGSPENWIRCRCLLQRVGEGKSMAGNATAFTEDEAIVAAANGDEDMVDATDLTDDDMIESAGGPVPFHGVAAPTDIESGDGRLLRKTGASFRTLPLPLLWQRQSADGHSQSTVVGRIDAMSLDDETGNVVYNGEFNTTPEAMEAIQGVAEGWLRGVSVDVDQAEIEMAEEDDPDQQMLTAFSAWRIAGVTMVAIPAFEQAFVALGPADDDPNPQVDDGAEADSSDHIVNEVARAYGLDASKYRVARQAEQTTNASSFVIMIDDEASPSSTGSRIRSANSRDFMTNGTGARLGSLHFIELGLSDPVLTTQYAAAAGEPSFVSDLDAFRASHSASLAAESTIGSTVIVPAVEVAVRTFDLTGATRDRANVIDRFSSGRAHARDVTPFKKYTADERKKSADAGHAMDDGSFPIENVDDLRNAIQAIGRAKDPAKAKAHIKKRARDLGHPEMIPDGWAAETAEFAPGTEDGPGWITNRVPTARLRRYWVHGEGAAKIGWNTPHDFYRCREHLGKYVGPAYINGTCANLHREATGTWPGREHGAHSLLEEATLMASAIGISSSSLLASAAPALEGAWEQGVGYGQVVSVPASRASGKTASEVLLPGDRLKVSGPDATAYAAKVVKVEAVGNRAVLSLEGEAVRNGAIPLSVAVGVHRSGPNPAFTTSDDEVIELNLTAGYRRASGKSASVVAFAHSAAEAASLQAITKGKFAASGTGHESQSTPQMAASINLVASAAPDVPPGEWFLDPELDGPTPFTVTPEGRVFGHCATWNVCHIGFDQVCTTAPSSVSGYAYYRTGEVETTLGPVAVGQVTMGAGHADLRAGAQAAAAHYDNVAHAVADVTAGEDAHGIWVAGALRPGLADEDVRALRAASLSGDWRRIRGNLEMVAALAVNVPGFPIPRNSIAASGQEQVALVAAGVVSDGTPPPPPPATDTDQKVADLMERIGNALADAQKAISDEPDTDVEAEALNTARQLVTNLADLLGVDIEERAGNEDGDYAARIVASAQRVLARRARATEIKARAAAAVRPALVARARRIGR